MLTKMQLLTLASAFLATEAAALALNAHRVNHHNFHNRREIVYQHTEMVVQTVYVTYDPETYSTSSYKTVPPPTPRSSFSSSSISSSPPPPPPPAPTPTLTPTPYVAPAAASPVKQQAVAPQAASSSTPVQVALAAVPAKSNPPKSTPTPSSTPTPKSTPAAPPPASSAPETTGGKRGLAYNTASLTTPFVGDGSKCSWAYNWGQTSNGLSASNVEYVPMLWGPQQMHTSTWTKNADAAIANGAKHMLSFNECDNTGQCNTDPATAAQKHIELMNPYGSKASISSPSITNSNTPGQGVDWLKSWVTACNGQCKFDFCAAHWYSPADVQALLLHLDTVHDACQGKDVWLTEFAPLDGDADQFLSDVIKQLDSNPKYNYVKRYAFFFVTLTPEFTSARMMTTASTLSSLGQMFAYS